MADATKRLLGGPKDKLRDLRKHSAFLVSLRLQLLPVMPFGAYNYAAGASKISFWGYLAGTAIGILPGTVAAVVVGDRLAAGIRGSGRWAFVVAAAVMTAVFGISFLPKLIERKRRGS